MVLSKGPLDRLSRTDKPESKAQSYESERTQYGQFVPATSANIIGIVCQDSQPWMKCLQAGCVGDYFYIEVVPSAAAIEGSEVGTGVKLQIATPVVSPGPHDAAISRKPPARLRHRVVLAARSAPVLVIGQLNLDMIEAGKIDSEVACS